MCDYSLMGVPNRLAHDGEDLVLFQFRTGALGLTPQHDFSRQTEQAQCRKMSFQSFLRRLLTGTEANNLAVCIPPGARLRLLDIPKDLQTSLGIGASEEATFTQLTAEAHTYRDAIRFNNGRAVLLQRLREGQKVKVLRLSLDPESDPLPQIPAERVMPLPRRVWQ
jgi:hypothetical protein